MMSASADNSSPLAGYKPNNLSLKGTQCSYVEAIYLSMLLIGLQRVGVWSGNEFGYFHPGSTGALSGIFDIVCTVSVHLCYIES